MVLILTNEDDYSTNEVIDWLIHYNADFRRINGGEYLLIDEIEIGNSPEASDITIVTQDGERLSFREIKAYWYRRGEIRIHPESHIQNELFALPLKDIDSKNELKNGTGFLDYFNGEIGDLSKYLNSYLQGIPSIGSFFHNYTNKLENLRIAESCGLTIPETLITGNKSNAAAFIVKHGRTIGKAIRNGIGIKTVDFTYSGMTVLYTEEDIELLPEIFFPQLFQQCINKRYELRVFFLDDEFYASAIFSQNDKKTELDFRNYNYERPNRTPPYNLPSAIKTKLISFMKMVGMNSGSIDMVVTDKMEFIFLEVNPIGQFSQVSKPCNYHLEKRIAQNLIDKHGKQKN